MLNIFVQHEMVISTTDGVIMFIIFSSDKNEVICLSDDDVGDSDVVVIGK